MTRRRISRRVLDEWFGTIAHYAGLGGVVYAVLIDRLRNPAILPAAMGLIFLRNVTGNGNGKKNGNGNGNGQGGA